MTTLDRIPTIARPALPLRVCVTCRKPTYQSCVRCAAPLHWVANVDDRAACMRPHMENHLGDAA